MKQALLTSVCKWIPGTWLELPKQSLNPARSIPWVLLRVRESKEYGGVYANVFSSFLIQQCVVEGTLAKSWETCLLDPIPADLCDVGKVTYLPWNFSYLV